jgi:hypothetical protein
MNTLIEKHREVILKLARERGVYNVRVFGSMARDESLETSDVDILVDVGPDVSGFGVGGLLMDLQELLGRKVDVVTENALHPTIRKRVLSEAIPL